MFAYYYLWWSTLHWHDTLGPNYPYSSNPLPVPASLTTTGCGAKSLFAKNRLTDAPTSLWSQDDAGTIARDVQQAMGAGLAGFAVNWVGTGQASQSASSNSYSKRLQMLVDAVDQVRRQGHDFSLWISYKSSAQILSTQSMKNDLGYLSRSYGTNPAFDHSFGQRPTLIFMGSRKYPTSTLAALSSLRSQFYLVGDENQQSWTPTRAAYLDADQYYWSSQDPAKNPASFDQLRSLAAEVRSSGLNADGTRKGWIAPLAPGYNKEIAGGSTCVPRRSGATMQAIYQGNKASTPDAWVVISWNEITEGTYLVPLQRYGNQSLNALAAIIRGG
jgi:hypothetical protein